MGVRGGRGVGRLGGLGDGCWVVGLVVGWLGWLFVLGCENMGRHRKAKADDKKEGSGELVLILVLPRHFGRVVQASAC